MKHNRIFASHQTRGVAHAVHAMCVRAAVADGHHFRGSPGDYVVSRVAQFDLVRPVTKIRRAKTATLGAANPVLGYHAGAQEIDAGLCTHRARAGAPGTALDEECGVSS